MADRTGPFRKGISISINHFDPKIQLLVLSSGCDKFPC